MTGVSLDAERAIAADVGVYEYVETPGCSSARPPATAPAEAHEMAAEVIRGGLTALAIWWSEHLHVPREQVVATAVNVLWIGFERVRRGERWTPAVS